MKLLIVGLLALMLFSCGATKFSPTPGSAPTATPYPTPSYDPASYIPPVRSGKTVTVRGENLADQIQAAQNDPSVTTVKIEGGGSIAKQVTLPFWAWSWIAVIRASSDSRSTLSKSSRR